MIKLFKKAFTLVELLVVIAILGALATIGIVGYSNYVKKANTMKDESIITQWNILLDAEDTLGNEYNNVLEIKELFRKNNTSDYKANTKEYTYYWNKLDNNVYLGDSNKDVIYPSDYVINNKQESYPLDKEYYTVHLILEHCSCPNNDVVVMAYDEVSMTVIADDGYYFNLNINNDKTTFDNTTGILHISYVSMDTIRTISATKYIDVTSVELNYSNVDLLINETLDLDEVVLPSNATNKTVAYSSSDTSILTVDNNGLVTPVSVGSATVTVMSNDNNTIIDTCTITVKKITPTVTAPTVVSNLVYTGNQLSLINAGSSNGGTLKYKVGNSEYSTTIPTMKDANTYTLYYKVFGNDTYYDSNESSINITIAKANATITVDQTPITKTYGEAVVIPTATTNFGTVSCDKTPSDLVNANNYTITYTVSGTSNYNGDSKTVSVTINKANQTIVAPTATSDNINTTSVTLTAISEGLGNTGYGYSTTNNSSNVTNWQEGLTFNNMSANTTYYFFAKYHGNSNYNGVISSSTEIKTKPNTYTVTYNKNDGDWKNEYTATTSYTYGAGLTLPTSDNITKSGYTFDGWYEESDFSGNVITSISTTDTGNKTYYAKWNENYKSLTATIGGSQVKYYPVLGGTNPEPTSFAFSEDGTTFTPITKTGTGNTYQMSDIASYAKEGKLYYTGTVFAVRSVNGLTWNDVFKDNSGGHYPYQASTDKDNLQQTILNQIDTDNEYVFGFSTEEDCWEFINGVDVRDVYSAYGDGTLNGFGGIEVNFWSNFIDEHHAYWCVEENECDTTNPTANKNVLIYCIFN